MATARSAVARVAAGSAANGQSRPLEHLDEEVDPFRGRSREPDAEVGQALADEALGRVDEQDRGLEAALPVDQVGLLPGVLEVVARVGLVGDRCRAGLGARTGQVGVDVDPRAAAAVEPVVGAPTAGRVTRETRRSSPSGRPNIGGGRGPEARDEPVQDGRQPIERDLEAPASQRGQPIARAARRRAGARRSRAAAAVERVVRVARRRVREAARDVVEVRQRVAGERRPPGSRARPAGRRARRAGRASATSAARRSRSAARRRAGAPASEAAPCRPAP